MSNSSQWTGQGQGLRLWLCSCARSVTVGWADRETARQPGRHQGNRRSHSNSMAKYSYLPTCMYVCMYIYLLRVPDSTPDSQDVVASSSPSPVSHLPRQSPKLVCAGSTTSLPRYQAFGVPSEGGRPAGVQPPLLYSRSSRKKNSWAVYGDPALVLHDFYPPHLGTRAFFQHRRRCAGWLLSSFFWGGS